uniref:Heat shock factor 1 n=1 Tax=Chionodraco rastrospinosus TaxID=34790 RepID=A0A873QKU5_CHIRA|nr:heat shock factor 1 [Chionodraco rastrospinosus]
MECPGGGGAVLGPANVPAFLTKLWTLVEDPDTDPLICWSPSGTSFHVFDQGRFSKEVLPKFFKHNNMASFIRQLNMYGFRKVVHIEQGGLVKPERDDTEFQHPFFLRGQEHLLENIKRKVTTVSSVRPEEVKVSSDDVNKILSDVQLMKGKQETIDSRIIAMRQENEALWREVASLRQKHVQQQKVVNKLIHFLVSLVQSNRVLGVKREIPLMLNDSSSAHSLPKYSRPFSLEQAAASLFPADPPLTSGPIISDLTDVATPPADSVLSDWSDTGESQSVEVKEEPSNPVDSPVDTPLSPTTFINSILLDHEQPPLNPPNTAGPSPTSSGPPPQCQTVACIDRSPRPPPSAGGLSPDVWRLVSTRPDKCELSHHVDSIDSGLQSLLNSQALNFDPSPLMEFFSSPCPSGDFDLDSLDTLLSDDAPNGGEESIYTGGQLVQYTGEGGGAYLPSLLELEAEPFFISDPPTDGPASTLLSPAHLDSDL